MNVFLRSNQCPKGGFEQTETVFLVYTSYIVHTSNYSYTSYDCIFLVQVHYLKRESLQIVPLMGVSYSN